MPKPSPRAIAGPEIDGFLLLSEAAVCCGLDDRSWDISIRTLRHVGSRAVIDPVAFVRAYLTAIERDELVGRESDWYAPDVEQTEWPNQLNPVGATRNLAELREAGERGRAIVASQSYEVINQVAQGQSIAVEAIFRATFRISLRDLPEGSVMEARFAMFFEMKDGRIWRHRTYDCFVPREQAKRGDGR